MKSKPLSDWNKSCWQVILAYTLLAALFCSNFFSWTGLESHSIQTGDPALNAWALQWVSKSITADPLNIFNGNAFYPAPNSIALSEHMFSLGLINTIFRPFSESPWFGYNMLIFLAYLLSSLGAYKLIFHITGSRLAGCWSGIFWGFLFFRVHHISHLQILSFQWIPYAVYYLLRYIRTGDNRSALGLICFFTLQALVSWYLAVICTFISIFVFAWVVDRRFWAKPRWKSHIFILLSVGVALIPFVIPYIDMQEASTLSDRMEFVAASGGNVRLMDYLHPPQGTLLGELIPQNRYWIWQENTLYIGYIPLLLSLLAVVFFLSGSRKMIFPDTGLTSSRIFWMGAMLCLGGYVMAKGFIASGWNLRLPLSYLADIVPFLAGMRATQRFSLMIYFGVMLLSSLGVYLLAAKVKSTKILHALVAIFCALYIVEVYPYHLPVKPDKTFAYSKLDAEILKIQSNFKRSLTILYLPIFYFQDDYPVEEATYMVGSTLHWAKIVNGFSGELPDTFGERMTILNTFPSGFSMKILKDLNADYVALDKRLPLDRRNAILKEVRNNGMGRILSISENEQLIELDKSFAAAAGESPFPPPVFLDFRKEFPVTFITRGLSVREDWGRWTKSDTAVVKLKGLFPERFKLVLEGFAFGPNIGQPIKIRIGDAERVIFLSGQKSTVSLEFSGVKDAESLLIHIPKPVSPRELGVGGDRRKRGIGIISLQIL